MSNNPIVTIVQLSYNNEKYIAEALNGVFAQTYTPLQIIISDDCSQDKSFSIIEKMVAEYNGPHQVLLHRNTENLGLGDNVNRVMELAEGELIIESDGDDISFPSRVADTVNLWQESGKKYLVMCGKSVMINEAGEPVGRNLQKLLPITFDKVLHSTDLWVQGGSLSWHRSLFDIFGPLRQGVVSQDKAIGFRSLLLGQEIGYIEEPVIQYRLHNLSLTNDRTTLDRMKHKVANFGSYVQDFEKVRSLNYLKDRDNVEGIYREFSEMYSSFQLRYLILTSSLFKSVLGLITCGNRLTISQKKNLLIRRLKRNTEKAGW